MAHAEVVRCGRPARERTAANAAHAISFAAYRAAVDLFPGSVSSVFDPLMLSLGYNAADHSTDTTTPTGMGNVAAQAVLDFHHRDGANQLGDERGGGAGVLYSDYTGYVPANDPMDIRVPFDPTTVHDPNAWQPLRYVDDGGTVVTPGFVGAQWQHVTTFAVSPGSLRSATGPAKHGSPEYLAQAEALIDLSAALTEEQKMIAEYWADGPRSELPPGHWNLFAQFVSRRDHHGDHEHGLERDVKLFFALTNAVSDAGCCAWDNKRAFNSVRPITAIRTLFRGQMVRAWGGPLPGHETDRRRDLVSLPADDVSDAAVPRVLVRTQQLQRRRCGDPQTLHTQRPLRRRRDARRRQLEGRAGSSPEQRRHALLVDVLRRGQ